MAITVLVAAGFMFGGGVLSDHLGVRIPILLGFLFVSFVGFLLLVTAGSVIGLVVACTFIGAAQGGTSGPLIALLADLTSDDRMGRAMGTNNVLDDVDGGLGPMISLPLVESVGFASASACAVIPFSRASSCSMGCMYRRAASVHKPRSAGERSGVLPGKRVQRLYRRDRGAGDPGAKHFYSSVRRR